MTTTTETLTLDQLYPHSLNPRTHHDPEGVALKAASIKSLGLISNLSGYRDPGHDGIGIVAGEYRRLALESLATAGHDLPPIRVEVTDDVDTARAWAMAENVARVELSPVDEIRHYRTRAGEGQSAAQIAREFGQTERHVKGRMKLASLPDPILDGLDAGEITLDAAAAFTTAPSDARALEVFEAARGKDWNITYLKRELHGDQIAHSDRRVQYLGLERIEAAGIEVQRSIFFEDSWITCSPDQLDELFAAELEHDRAEIEEEEGWDFVWTSDRSTGWETRQDPRLKGYQEIEPEPVGLPDADQAEWERLSEMYPHEMSDDQKARLEDLETRARGSYTEEQLAACGVMIFVNSLGELQRIEGLMKPEATGADDGADGTTTPKPKEPDMPATVLDDMSKIALAARQRAAMGKYELLLDLLAYELSEARGGWECIFALTAEPKNVTPDVPDDLHVTERLIWPDHDFDAKLTGAGFAAFQEKGKAHRNQVLGDRLARLLTFGTSSLAENLNAATEVNPRKIWTPTAKNFFGRLRGPMLDKIMQDVLHDAEADRLAAFAKLKVKEKARELGDLFSNAETQEAWGLSREQITRLDTWIPPEMAAHIAMPPVDDSEEQEAA